MIPRERTLSAAYAVAFLYKREGKPRRPNLRAKREVPTWKGAVPLGRPLAVAAADDTAAIRAYLARVAE